jgi:hypothetical protein
VGYCYPSGFEKTLCKWDIYVPLVTKKLIEAIAFRGSVKTFFFFHLCSVLRQHLKCHFVVSAKDRLSVRFQDRGHCRTCAWIPESFYCKRSFSPCIPTCLSIPHSGWCSDDNTTHLPHTYFPQDPGCHPKCPLHFPAAARDVMERA